jgi:hypothetical protein
LHVTFANFHSCFTHIFQQEALVRQLQDQHYVQYMQQFYSQQLLQQQLQHQQQQQQANDNSALSPAPMQQSTQYLQQPPQHQEQQTDSSSLTHAVQTEASAQQQQQASVQPATNVADDRKLGQVTDGEQVESRTITVNSYTSTLLPAQLPNGVQKVSDVSNSAVNNLADETDENLDNGESAIHSLLNEFFSLMCNKG